MTDSTCLFSKWWFEFIVMVMMDSIVGVVRSDAAMFAGAAPL